MKIAICDDERPVFSQLRKFISQYAVDKLFDYTILEFDKSEQFLEAASQDSDRCKYMLIPISRSSLH